MPSTATQEVGNLIRARFSDYTDSQIIKICSFYEILVAENATQNLTRLTSPDQFVEGHFRDVHELIHSGWLGSRNLDLGSGCGVPGVLSAIADPNRGHKWIAIDAERAKAEFLIRATNVLGISDVAGAIWGRAEDKIRDIKPDVVVSRAVGTIKKIYGWIRNCSTWNNLVLFKGPSWPEEWNEFKGSEFGNALELVEERRYATVDNKQRLIIQIARVPRGTKKNLPK